MIIEVKDKDGSYTSAPWGKRGSQGAHREPEPAALIHDLDHDLTPCRLIQTFFQVPVSERHSDPREEVQLEA